MLTARTVSISLATTRSALAHYHPKTRSGAIFSPFKTVDIGCVIDSFIETAVCAETAHEEEEDDDTEGLPLTYAPSSSSPSSPTPSPPSSPTPSPPTSRPPSPPLYSAMSMPSSSALPACMSTRTHKQAGYYKRRQKKRAEKKNIEAPKIRSSQSKRYQSLNYVKTSFSALSLPVTRAGFIGKRSKVIAQHRTLESYLEEGFQIVPWDGK